VKRREFIGLLAGTATWPLAARAQQPDRMRRIGVLQQYAESDPEGQARLAAFLDTFQGLGWSNGRNAQVEVRWPGAEVERMKAYSAELVALAPDAILCASGPGAAVMKQATRTVPVVFVQVSDPVGSGLVAGLARPGGNITGFQNFEPAVVGKWLGLLKEAAPNVSRAAVLLHPENAVSVAFLRAAEAVAPSLAVQMTAAGVHDGAEIERAIVTFANQADGGLIFLPDPILVANRGLIIELAARHRLPAVYPFRYFATEGGLMSYGIDQIDQWRGAARYVDRILRGEKPGELPVQAPTKFELVINLQAAKAIGHEVPAGLVLRADQVIE
jgi:putative ABC transport system substrate-binding protein